MKYRRRRYFGVFICFLVLILWSSASAWAEDVFLFSRPLSGVYLMRGDSEKRIIYRQGAHINPRLSPDGERILFHSRQGGKIGIWIANLQGEEKERVCDGEQASWSPDGKRIVFSREGAIMERDMVAGKEKLVVRGSGENLFPSYLPDGRIIYVLDERKIYLIDVENEKSLERLVKGAIKSAPRCSPDGKQIAYQNGAHIYLMNLADKKTRQLTIAGGVQSCPVWSQDGKSICYCQSPDDFGGRRNICNVAIDSPEDVHLVVRDVEAGYDWHGSAPPVSDTTKLKGGSISLWQIGKSLQDKKGWKPLTVEKEFEAEGGIVVESDWGLFHLPAQGSEFLVLTEYMERLMGITVADTQGKLATETQSVHVLSNDGENVVLRIGFRSENGDVMEAIFTIPRNRPVIEIEPSKNVGKVSVRRKMLLALLPDRFADDLIFVPDEYSASRVPLPSTRALIGLARNDIILICAPSDKQRMWLTKGADSFETIEISTGGERIFVSFLSGRTLWQKTKPVRDLDTDGWKARWSKPFLAQWRAAATGNGKYYSRMWGAEDLSKLKGAYLPVAGESPELAVVYLYGRSWNTPLDIITPADILRDTLGMDMLDVKGVRGYRTAEEPVLLHTFLTSQSDRLWPGDSPGFPKSLDFSPFYQLLKRVRTVERPGVETTLANLCGDISNLLKSLDDRIEEYEKFVAELEALCEADEELETVKEDAESLRLRLIGLRITEMEKIADAIEALEGCMGIGEMLWDNDEITNFRNLSDSVLAERQEVLTRYRDFIKKVRNDAGIMLTKNPKTRDISEKIRELARNVLRDRYYLEGDWRGEEPL